MGRERGRERVHVCERGKEREEGREPRKALALTQVTDQERRRERERERKECEGNP